MKNMYSFLIGLFCFFITINGFAQVDYNQYLSKLPSFPSNYESLSEKQKSDYLTKVDQVLLEMKQQIDFLKAESMPETMANVQQAKKNAIEKIGTSEEELKALENASDEEQEEWGAKMAEKQVQSQLGISMSELMAMEEMDEDEQEAMAQKMASKMMGNKKNLKKAAEAAQTGMNLVEAQRLRVQLVDQHKSFYENLESALNDLRKQAQSQYDKELEPLYREYKTLDLPDALYQGKPADIARAKVLDGLIAAAKVSYIRKFTPVYLDIINREKSKLPEKLANAEELYKVDKKLYESQLGVNMEIEPLDAAKLQWCYEYAKLYGDVFQFDLRDDYEKGITN